MAKEKLTRTQRIILGIAAKAPKGIIVMGRPDRRGTRQCGSTERGEPIIMAYQTPELFLTRRGLLKVWNRERHFYQITPAGRKAWSDA